MNQSCPECGGANENFICNFCGNKPPNAITGEILQKAGEFANEEQRKIFYKDQDPYEEQGKEYKGNCTCGCHTSEHSDTEMKLNGCDLCYQDEVHQDPYLSQGSNLRVHHPVQPKTQVEKWREEIKENRMAYITCISCGDHECYKCLARLEKMQQLRELISQATQPIHPRYPTGTFADDYEQKFFEEKHEGYVIEKNPSKKDIGEAIKILEGKVTLLDKIKKLLWKKQSKSQ